MQRTTRFVSGRVTVCTVECGHIKSYWTFQVVNVHRLKLLLIFKIERKKNHIIILIFSLFFFFLCFLFFLLFTQLSLSSLSLFPLPPFFIALLPLHSTALSLFFLQILQFYYFFFSNEQSRNKDGKVHKQNEITMPFL